MSAGSIIIDLLMRTGSFETDTERASRSANRNARAIQKSFTEMGRQIGLAAGAAGAALTAMVVTTANTAKEISNLAAISGAGVGEFQRFAAGAKSVGIEQDKLGDIFKDFREKVGEFVQTGGGGMKDFFEQIAPKVGITADAFRNLSGPQALQLYVDTLQKAGLSQEQMSFYLESMASDTTALIPLLRDGGRAMQELGAQAQATGQIMDDAAVASAKRLSMQMDELSGYLTGLKNQIAQAIIPGLTDLSGYFLSVARDVGFANAALITFGRYVALITGTDELSKLTKEAKNAQFNIERLGRQLETALKMPFNLGENAAKSILGKLEAEMKNQQRISALIKQLTKAPAAPPAAIPMATMPWSPPAATKAVKTPSARSTVSKPTGYQDPDPLGTFAAQKMAAQNMRDEAAAMEELNRQQQRLNELLGVSALEKQREDMQLLAGAVQAGKISMEEYELAVRNALGQGEGEGDEGSYWDKWLASAQGAMLNFEDLASNVIDNFTSGFGNAFEKMIFDSQNFNDAMQNLFMGMSRAIVNSLGEMAAQWVASEFIKRMASQATTATVIAGTAAQTSAALAANTAATASAAVTGPSIAAAMAPAAVTTSVATAGANTFPAIAGMMAAMALLPLLAGARANGGPVSADQTYLVGERGPELFTPNRSGGIVPNNKLNNGGVTVNLIEDKSRAGQTETRANNGAQEIDVFVADIMGDGPRSKAMRTAFGLQRRGY
jgi:hypothetical protein